MLRCPDKDCGWFGERSSAEAEFDTDLTVPDVVDHNGDAEFGIDVSVTFSCPDCGAEFDGEKLSGETRFNVEMG